MFTFQNFRVGLTLLLIAYFIVLQLRQFYFIYVKKESYRGFPVSPFRYFDENRIIKYFEINGCIVEAIDFKTLYSVTYTDREGNLKKTNVTTSFSSGVHLYEEVYL